MFHKVILEWQLAVFYIAHLKVSCLVSPSGLTRKQGCERKLVEVYGLHAQSWPQSNYFPWTKCTWRVASAYCSGNGQCLPEDSSPDFHHALWASALGHCAEANWRLKHQIESLCTMGHSQAFKCDSTVVWDLSVWSPGKNADLGWAHYILGIAQPPVRGSRVILWTPRALDTHLDSTSVLPTQEAVPTSKWGNRTVL